MKIIEGNLVKLAKEGEFDLIVHGCNCFCTMNSGIAKELRAEFPAIYSEDLKTKRGDQSKLGTYSYIFTKGDTGKRLIIVNGYTQFTYGIEKIQVDYEAIRSVFRSIKKDFPGLKIGYPAIGAGRAGGDWNIISKIIEEELQGEDHTFVVFVP